MTYTPHRSAPVRADEFEDGVPVAVARRRKRAWVAGGILAALLLVGFGVWAVQAGPGPATTVVLPDLSDGGSSSVSGFEMAADGVRCGVQQVGEDGLEQRAEGEFCLVDVVVTNVGLEAELFDSSTLRALDTNGEAYPVAERAVAFLNDRSPSLLDEARPDVPIRAVLPFDVPPGTRLATLARQDGMSTGGIRVNLPSSE